MSETRTIQHARIFLYIDLIVNRLANGGGPVDPGVRQTFTSVAYKGDRK